jgi:hypothetical protein
MTTIISNYLTMHFNSFHLPNLVQIIKLLSANFHVRIFTFQFMKRISIHEHE